MKPWPDTRIEAALQSVAVSHDDVTTDALWRWVEIVPLLEVERLLKKMRDEYEKRIDKLESEIGL